MIKYNHLLYRVKKNNETTLNQSVTQKQGEALINFQQDIQWPL